MFDPNAENFINASMLFNLFFPETNIQLHRKNTECFESVDGQGRYTIFLVNPDCLR